MLRKVAVLASIALAVAWLSAASPAGAKPESGGLRISVTGNYEAASASNCSYTFSYEQRMVVDGRMTMVPVSSVVPPGHYEAFLHDTTCEGYDIYAFGTCACHYVFVET